MSLLRAETRTEGAWQRFDKLAGIVAILLLVSLIAIWLRSTGLLGGNSEPDVATPAELARVDTETASGDPAGPDAGITNAGAAVSPGTDDEAPVPVLAGDAPAAADSADQSAVESAKTPAGGDATGDPAAGSDKDAQTAASPEAATPAGQDAPLVQTSDEPASTDSAATAKSSKDGDDATTPGALAGPGAVAPGPGKSLASQDPERQATFERIPLNINKPITVAPDAQIKPILELRSSGGRLTVDGIVNAEDIRGEILRTALQTYGMRNLNDRLTVNTAVAPFEWSGSVSDLMEVLGGPASEASLRIDGDVVTLTGEVPSLEDKQARALAAQQFFGTTAQVSNRLEVVVPVAPVAAEAPADDKAAEPSPAPALDKPVVVAAADQQPAAAGEPPTPGPAAPETTAGGDSGPSADSSSGTPASVASANPTAESTAPPVAEEPAQQSTLVPPRPVPEDFKLADCAKIATGIRIPFRSGSSSLPPEGREVLDTVQACLKRRRYIVGGHTDNLGSAINNLILSQERAQSAVDYLISKGVPPSRLTPKGYGESRPIATNKTEVGRALNRRIDFRFDK